MLNNQAAKPSLSLLSTKTLLLHVLYDMGSKCVYVDDSLKENTAYVHGHITQSFFNSDFEDRILNTEVAWSNPGISAVSESAALGYVWSRSSSRYLITLCT